MYCTVCIFDTVTALLQNGIHYTHAANSCQFHLMVKTNPRFIVMIWNWAQPYSKLPRGKKKKESKQLEDIGLYSFPFCFVLILVKSTDSLLTAFRFDYLICPWSHSFISYLTVFSTELSIWATFLQFREREFQNEFSEQTRQHVPFKTWRLIVFVTRFLKNLVCSVSLDL